MLIAMDPDVAAAFQRSTAVSRKCLNIFHYHLTHPYAITQSARASAP